MVEIAKKRSQTQERIWKIVEFQIAVKRDNNYCMSVLHSATLLGLFVVAILKIWQFPAASTYTKYN